MNKLKLGLGVAFLLIKLNSLYAQVTHGMVVSAHPEASKVGLAILRGGGNAVDAAIAVNFALAVVHPAAGNIGGGGFMLYRSANGTTDALDFREEAPAKATKNMYLDPNGNFLAKKSIFGQLAVGVPGAVAGMVEAHKKYGKLAWAVLVQPAIILAEKGVALTTKEANNLNDNRAYFIKYNRHETPFVKKGGLWKAGDVLVQKELAHTLELIRDKGNAGFYQGAIAKKIVAEMRRGKGFITYKDLKDYKPVWRKPITGNYKGHHIITMPPPSSGGTVLLQLLHMVEKYPLERWGFNQDSSVQLIVEAERRAYADRDAYLGDPDFNKVPLDELLKPSYAVERMQDLNWDAATPSAQVQPGLSAHKESEQTTHFSIVDRDGNAVSLTTTLNLWYGSKVVVKGAGFILNNEMDDFSAKVGVPNFFGVIGGEANAIAPKKRMLSTMAPTIIEKNGQLWMIVGAPGGSTIATSIFQTILNVIEFDKNIQEAVAAPRFHHQWIPDTVFMERNAFSPATEAYLEAKGYHLKTRKPIGQVEAILKFQETYWGGADPRGDNTVMGW